MLVIQEDADAVIAGFGGNSTDPAAAEGSDSGGGGPYLASLASALQTGEVAASCCKALHVPSYGRWELACSFR